MDRVDRRKFIRLGGAASLVTAAGCIDDENGDNGDVDDDRRDREESEASGDDDGDVSYDQYIAADDGKVFYVYADIGASEESEDDDAEDGDTEDGDPEENSQEGPPEWDEAMLAPLNVSVSLGFMAGFALASGDLGDLFASEGESDLESSADELLLSTGGLVVVGDMDTEEIDEQLTAEPDDDASLSEQFVEDGEIAGYTVYVSAEDDEGNVFLVGDEEIIHGNSLDEVEIMVDVIGGGGRATDEIPVFDDLLETAGDGGISMGSFGDESANEYWDIVRWPLREDDDNDDDQLSQGPLPNGFVSSLNYLDDQVSTVLAAEFEDLSEDERSALRDEFESDRTEVSVEFDDGQLVAEATYEDDVLDEAAE